MKFIRRFLVFMLAALVVIQFFRPSKNIAEGIALNDISTKYTVPDSIAAILKVACNDCHSNNSRYPWYWNFQPVAWFLNGHITAGKGHLNFSDFAAYPIARQYKMFDNINKEIKGGGMPLGSYTLIHRDAILSDNDKAAFAAWTAGARKQIENHYPPDSLIMKKKMRD